MNIEQNSSFCNLTYLIWGSLPEALMTVQVQ